MSGTIFQSETFTDGKTDVRSGAYGEDPYLIRCRQCHDLFLFHDNISEGNEDVHELSNLGFEEHYLHKEDYYEALQELEPLSPEKERDLRILLWWAINDIIRNDAGWGKRRSLFWDVVNFTFKPLQKIKRLHYRFPEYRKWLTRKTKNLWGLLPLLNPLNDINDACLSVEIYRELAEFSLAREQLKLLSIENCSTFYRNQKRLLKRRDRFVRKINYFPVMDTHQEVVLVTGE
jgi:hypothetical protein